MTDAEIYGRIYDLSREAVYANSLQTAGRSYSYGMTALDAYVSARSPAGGLLTGTVVRSEKFRTLNDEIAATTGEEAAARESINAAIDELQIRRDGYPFSAVDVSQSYYAPNFSGYVGPEDVNVGADSTYKEIIDATGSAYNGYITYEGEFVTLSPTLRAVSSLASTSGHVDASSFGILDKYYPEILNYSVPSPLSPPSTVSTPVVPPSAESPPPGTPPLAPLMAPPVAGIPPTIPYYEDLPPPPAPAYPVVYGDLPPAPVWVAPIPTVYVSSAPLTSIRPQVRPMEPTTFRPDGAVHTWNGGTTNASSY